MHGFLKRSHHVRWIKMNSTSSGSNPNHITSWQFNHRLLKRSADFGNQFFMNSIWITTKLYSCQWCRSSASTGSVNVQTSPILLYVYITKIVYFWGSRTLCRWGLGNNRRCPTIFRDTFSISLCQLAGYLLGQVASEKEVMGCQIWRSCKPRQRYKLPKSPVSKFILVMLSSKKR